MRFDLLEPDEEVDCLEFRGDILRGGFGGLSTSTPEPSIWEARPAAVELNREQLISVP